MRHLNSHLHALWLFVSCSYEVCQTIESEGVLSPLITILKNPKTSRSLLEKVFLTCRNYMDLLQPINYVIYLILSLLTSFFYFTDREHTFSDF